MADKKGWPNDWFINNGNERGTTRKSIDERGGINSNLEIKISFLDTHKKYTLVVQ